MSLATEIEIARVHFFDVVRIEETLDDLIEEVVDDLLADLQTALLGDDNQLFIIAAALTGSPALPGVAPPRAAFRRPRYAARSTRRSDR